MRLTDATAEDLEAVEKSLEIWAARGNGAPTWQRCPLCVLAHLREAPIGRGCPCVLETGSENGLCDAGGIFGRGPGARGPAAFPAVRYLSWLRDYLTAYLHNEDLGE